MPVRPPSDRSPDSDTPPELRVRSEQIRAQLREYHAEFAPISLEDYVSEYVRRVPAPDPINEYAETERFLLWLSEQVLFTPQQHNRAAVILGKSAVERRLDDRKEAFRQFESARAHRGEQIPIESILDTARLGLNPTLIWREFRAESEMGVDQIAQTPLALFAIGGRIDQHCPNHDEIRVLSTIPSEGKIALGDLLHSLCPESCDEWTDHLLRLDSLGLLTIEG